MAVTIFGLHKTDEVIKMNENIVKIEAQGFQDLCNHIRELENENKQLKEKNQLLKKEYDDFYEKEYLARIDECNNLWAELFDIKHMSMWEFASKYCKDELENAGKQFARDLLGQPMTQEDIAIEAAENCYVPYNGDDF